MKRETQKMSVAPNLTASKKFATTPQNTIDLAQNQQAETPPPLQEKGSWSKAWDSIKGVFCAASCRKICVKALQEEEITTNFLKKQFGDIVGSQMDKARDEFLEGFLDKENQNPEQLKSPDLTGVLADVQQH